MNYNINRKGEDGVVWVDGHKAIPRARVQHRRARVLVVDDEPLVRQALGRFLGCRGCEVTLAGSAGAALEALTHQTIDLIVTDHDMPGVNGIELLSEMRELYPCVVRILCSGGHPPRLREALDTGLVDVFVDKLEATNFLMDLVQSATQFTSDEPEDE